MVRVTDDKLFKRLAILERVLTIAVEIVTFVAAIEAASTFVLIVTIFVLK